MDRRMLNTETTRFDSTAFKASGTPKCDRMDTLMCQSTTSKESVMRIVGILALTAITAAAQIPADPLRPNWRRVGGSAMDLVLASPATGPVSRVWFSPDGLRLFAQTASGRVF